MKHKMKILITSVDGFLGKKANSILSKDFDTIGTVFDTKNPNYTYLDIGNEAQVKELFDKIKPNVVINCSAICNLDICSINPELAKQVHEKGTQILARNCKKHNAIFVYISTDYIFDGKNSPYLETSQPNPLNTYGKTKLNGENVAKQTLENHIILRPTILYGYNDTSDKPTFPTQIISKLNSQTTTDIDNVRKNILCS